MQAFPLCSVLHASFSSSLCKRIISTQGAPLPILAPGPLPDPTEGKEAHELKHDFDDKYGNLLLGGMTNYEGLEPQGDASKGYDWMVKWGEPYC